MNILSYFKELKAARPKLFKIAIASVICYLFLNIIRLEQPPFFLSMMYSVPQINTDTQHVYIFNYNNGKQWNKHEYWNHHQRITFSTTIEYFNKYKQNQNQPPDGKKLLNALKKTGKHPYFDHVFTSTEEIATYPVWIKHYMEKLVNEPIINYNVTKNTIVFTTNSLITIHSDTLINY